MKLSSCIYFLIISFLTAPDVRAELLYFREGGRLQAPIESSGQEIKIDLPEGVRIFARSDFAKIVDGYSPSKEWPARKAAALRGSESEQQQSIRWAVENGLSLEALEFLETLNPSELPLKRLKAMASRLTGHRAEPNLKEQTKALAGTFRTTVGRWGVLLHQHTAEEARERLEVLERVVVAFYLYWTDLGLDLKLPETLFVSAWYEKQSDYLHFLDREHASGFRGTKGYYHPTRELVVAYDTREDDAMQQSRLAIEALKSELGRVNDILTRLPRNARAKFERPGEPARSLDRQGVIKLRERLVADLARRQVLADLQWREVELGTAAHEMTHLLIVKSGLASRFDAFPLWLHEGLASQFETIEGGRWSGIAKPHPLRLPDYRTITPTPRLAPLANDVGLGQGYSRDAYAACWSFVNYAIHERPTEFLTFIASIQGPGVPTRTRIDLLRRAFGQDVPDLERDWHAWIRGQQTSLERESPRGTDPHPR